MSGVESNDRTGRGPEATRVDGEYMLDTDRTGKTGERNMESDHNREQEAARVDGEDLSGIDRTGRSNHDKGRGRRRR